MDTFLTRNLLLWPYDSCLALEVPYNFSKILTGFYCANGYAVF